MFLDTILEEPDGELDYSFESDIMDQRCIQDNNIYFSFEHEVPARPCSRLSFNRDTLDRSPFVEDEVSDNAYSEGGHPPFLPVLNAMTTSAKTKTGIRTTPLMLRPDPRSEASPSLSHEWGSGLAHSDPCIISDGEDSDIETEIDSDCSSYSDFDDETPPSPPSSPPLIHTFSPPLQEPDWSLRPKFSCLPSPLSPSHIPPDPYSPRQNPIRHYYGNHGLSRHALHHLKWFWAARDDEWVEHKARLCASKAYERLSIFDDIPSDQRLPSGCASPDRDVANRCCSPSPRAPLPPLSIHPRRGDLYTLRDPYCAHIDRYFVGMPLWTMSKTLWMFDVHVALERSCDAREETEEDAEGERDPYDEDQNAVELMERSVSVGFSDDSDSTLVESDNEGDVSMSERLVDILAEGVLDDGKSKSDLPPAPPIFEAESSSVSPFGRGVKSTSSLLEQEILGPSKPRPCNVEARGGWPKNWYGRWQVLLQLCLENQDLPHDALPPLPLADWKNTSVTLPLRPKARKFFIPDDEEDWNEETDGGQEEHPHFSIPGR